MLYEELILNHLDNPKPVFSDTSIQLTYEELNKLVEKLANYLKQYEISDNQRILIINGNSLYTVVSILTCIYLGICFIIVPEESSSQIAYILKDACPCLIIDTSRKFGEGITSTNLVNREPVAAKLIYIIYTSGTTSEPKGVMAGETQVEFCIRAINERLQNGESDRILCCLPLSFDYGLYQLFLALASGACLVLPRAFKIQDISKLLLIEKITAFPTVPSMLMSLCYSRLLERLLQNHNLPCLRYITSTGDILPVSLICKLHDLLPSTAIIPMYGQTECKRVSVMPYGCEDKVMAGSCGLPLSGTEVWISHPDNEGVGELIVSGPNVMEGYLHPDEAAAMYYFTDKTHGKSLRTGDLFRMDTDGFLYFCGRVRRMLKVSGHRVGLLEMETKLLNGLRTPIGALHIIGLDHQLFGNEIVICIYVKETDTDALLQELREMKSGLPGYMQPKKAYLTKMEFPLNENGKIDEKILKKNVLRDGTIPI